MSGLLTVRWRCAPASPGNWSGVFLAELEGTSGSDEHNMSLIPKNWRPLDRVET